jgi:transcriptional regulator with XRE-family HTH domain
MREKAGLGNGMKDEKFTKYLSELVASPRQLTDEEVDALLAPEPGSPPDEDDESAWPKFVETVLVNLHPKIVRSKGKNSTLGDFLKEARRLTNFTQEDVAAALGKDVSFIQQVEAGGPSLSSFDEGDTADLVSLLRIHSDVLEQILPKQLQMPSKRSGGDAGITAYVTELPNMKLSAHDAKWLRAVRSVLRERGQDDLVD